MSQDEADEHHDPMNPSPAFLEAEAKEAREAKGPIAWFARNSVAANVLMIILVLGGLVNLKSIKQEVFPGFELDMIMVQLFYPGAGPEEVERGALLATEEAVRGLDGVKEVNSTAQEGFGVVSVALKTGEDPQRRLNEIKAAVDRITSFPDDMERPNVFYPSAQWEVISLVIHGEASEKTLRTVGERMRERLLDDKRVSMVQFSGVRDYEISIEVPQENLRRYGLTLEDIAQKVRAAAVEVPGGGIKTGKGEVLIRTTERRYTGAEFEEVVLIARPDGTRITVGDIATVKDDFEDSDLMVRYNDKPALMMRAFRVGDEKPLEVAAAVRELVAKYKDELPPGIEMSTWMDMSKMYQQRKDLLTRNAMVGLVLVILVLGLFLDVRLAFWVTLGIPISFAGAFLFLPSTDVSVNMISMFAFIQVLGMVVDDAIVVGEAAYLRRQQGMKPIEAAIAGVREVAVPVCFAIITTIVMYIPMLLMPGIMGRFLRVIPIVVITVLLLSLLESLLILPAHLAHSKAGERGGIFGWISRHQHRFSLHFESAIARFYVPLLRICVRRRYMAICTAVAVLIASIGLLAGGRIRRIDMPDIDSDVVVCAARLPYGTPYDRAAQVEEELRQAVHKVAEANGGEATLMTGLYSQIGRHALTAKQDTSGGSAFKRGAHLVEVAVYLLPSGQRPIRSREFAKQWRMATQDIVGLEALSFNFATGPGSGPSIFINLSHTDYEVLRKASAEFAAALSQFNGTYDVSDGYEEGKEQLDFKLSDKARSLGVSEGSLAAQLRNAFFGAEAVRQQRGRDEVRTYVRLPKEERVSEYNLEEFLIRTPTGGEIPLSEAATRRRGTSFTDIRRSEGARVLSVTAMVDKESGDPKKINQQLLTETLPALAHNYPGLRFETAGPDKAFNEANGGLMQGFVIALLGVFALLAIAFRSYMQPLLIMLAIPFGFAGALWGHFVMGYDFSMMSMMGVVALSGVVVNDSLILIVAINENRERGMPLLEAITAGGQRRFRPILLTSLTTFFGLMPMVLETEVQAQFLAPMAVSLGFGVMAATAITLLVVPVCYHILHDAKRGAHQLGELVGFLEAQD